MTLALAPPRPNHRRVVALSVAALLIAVATASAVVVRGGSSSTAPVRGVPVTRIDSIKGVPLPTWPRSALPVGGMLFVRCTNLWAAQADGSLAHRLFSMDGLDSPTFSPDGRTIAFVAGGSQLWMAAADGSARRQIASLRSEGRPLSGSVTGLAWSPDSSSIAFAVTTPGQPLDTSSIWKVQIESGEITRAGTGNPVPVFLGGGLATTGVPSVGIGAGGSDLLALDPSRRWLALRAKRVSTEGDQLAVAESAETGFNIGLPVAVSYERADDGQVWLALRRSLSQVKEEYRTTPPDRSIDAAMRPAISSDGMFAGVTALDTQGGRDVGIYNTVTGRWAVLNYAWEPTWSPAIPATGTPTQDRAAAAARSALMLLSAHGEPGADELGVLLDDSFDRSVVPFRGYVQWTVRVPARSGEGWRVPATVVGRMGPTWAARDLTIRVEPSAGRLLAVPMARSSVHRLRTIPDAIRYLEGILPGGVLPASGLPSGARLASPPVQVYSSNGGSPNASLNVTVPTDAGGAKELTIGFGYAGFGCGSDPVPTTVAGQEANMTSHRSISQWNATPEVIWPASRGDMSARFSVAGEFDTTELLSIAATLEAARKH